MSNALSAWKLRFDGYGESNYDFSTLYKNQIPDALLYEPQGVSHVGGSFADTICVCNIPDKECKCKDAASTDAAKTTPSAAAGKTGAGHGGCGIPGGDM